MYLLDEFIDWWKSCVFTNLEKIFLQGSGYAKVPNSVITTRFSVMALTYASVLTNLHGGKNEKQFYPKALYIYFEKLFFFLIHHSIS